MAPAFATLDIGRLRDAAVANSLDGVRAALHAEAAPSPGEYQALAQKQHLEYTSLLPCRLVDTRILPSAKLKANTTRHFITNNPGGNFYAQGGYKEGDCGVPLDPKAVVIRVTVDATEASGYVTVFPYGSALPEAASLNYTGVGHIIGNELIARSAENLTSDISVFTSAGAHVIIDVVGYFSAPLPVTLTCYEERNVRELGEDDILHWENVAAPGCEAAGFQRTNVECGWSGHKGVNPIGYSEDLNACQYHVEAYEGRYASGSATTSCCKAVRAN